MECSLNPRRIVTMNEPLDQPFVMQFLQLPDVKVFVPANHTLLEAALLFGMRAPNSCRNGTCRTCICRLASGEVGYKIMWPGLSKEEKEEGLILPCVAMPLTDVVLDAPHVFQHLKSDT